MMVGYLVEIQIIAGQVFVHLCTNAYYRLFFKVTDVILKTLLKRMYTYISIHKNASVDCSINHTYILTYMHIYALNKLGRDL